MNRQQLSDSGLKMQSTNGKLRSFYSDLIESTPGYALILRSEDFRIVAFNSRFQYFSGFTQSDADNQILLFNDLLGNQTRERFKDFVLLCANNPDQRTGYFVTKLSSKQGVQTEFFTFASPVICKDAELPGYVMILLHPNHSGFEIPFLSPEAREVYLEHLHNYDFGLFEWISGEQTVFLSGSIKHILESDSDINEVNVERLSSFVAPQDHGRFQELIRKVISGDGVIQTEVKIITSKNNIKTLQLNAKRYLIGENQVKLVVSVRNITRERLIEQNYHKKVEELANSNAELEEFAYVASHDLQEPLRKISTFCSRLGQKYGERLEEEGKMYLNRALVSAENMRILINDLLEFSRISKTKQPFEPVDLNVIFRIVRTDLELSIEETHTTIHCDPLPMISGIKSQLIQLFTNLISNAIKFRSKDKQPMIHISDCKTKTEEKIEYGLDSQRDYIKLLFRDNGIGFENVYSTRIFQVFQRLHGRTEYAGSGIGLAICKKIAEHHQGAVFAAGRPGEGSVFTIVLPIILQAA